MTKWIAICTASTLLGGCGILGICQNTCGPGLVHDSFCGCQDYSALAGQTGGGGGGGGGAAADTAACICKYGEGNLEAWFTHRPTAYQDTSAPVSVRAFQCDSIDVCAGNPITYFIGTVQINARSWTQRTNLLNGNTVWILSGSQKVDKTEWLPNLPKVGVGLVALGQHALQQRVDEKPNNDAESCRATCGNDDNPFCEPITLDDITNGGFLALQAALSAKPSVIKSSDLLSMFQQSSDPCGRGDTSIDGGRLLNTGGECTLRTAIPNTGIELTLSVPAALQTTYANAAGKIDLNMAEGAAKPQLHFFPSDKDNAQDVKNASLLESDWGGEVRSVFGDANQVGFGVGEHNCVRADLGSH